MYYKIQFNSIQTIPYIICISKMVTCGHFQKKNNYTNMLILNGKNGSESDFHTSIWALGHFEKTFSKVWKLHIEMVRNANRTFVGRYNYSANWYLWWRETCHLGTRCGTLRCPFWRQVLLYVWTQLRTRAVRGIAKSRRPHIPCIEVVHLFRKMRFYSFSIGGPNFDPRRSWKL